MKMTKRVFKGISGMILTLVVGVGALNANAQCAADMVVLQNQSNCSSQVILEANVFGSNIQSWTFYLDGNIVGTGNSFVSLNLTPGVYIGEVAVITDQGCTAVDDTVFTVAGNPLEVDAGSDVVSCQAQTTLSVSVNSSNPYSINWYPEQYLNNSESANPIVTQNLDDQWFIVDVLDDVTGCINSDTIQVSQYGPIIEEFSLCDGPVEIDMGPGADFYEWLNYTDTAGNITSLTYPTTQQSIIVDDPGTYFIVADFAACGALTSQVVVEACTAAVCSSEFITSENVQNCGLWVDFAGTAFSSPVDSVVWNFGDGETYTDQGSGIFHEYGAGTFTATMTTYHTDGCISSSSEVFSFSNPLEVQLIEDTIACSGTLFLNQNTTGGSGNYGYSWVPSSAMNDPNAANPQMTVQNDVWVEVFVTDVQTGCTAADYMFVYANEAVYDSVEICSDSLQLELNPGSLVYSWSYTDQFGNVSQIQNFTNEIWVDEPGVYSCITYYSGCNDVTHTFIVEECAPQNDEVWPGDANSDNIVTNADALYLGLAFNQTGPVRPAATLNWVGQPCPDWNFNFVQNNVNLKHADCDGNGIINFDDTLAIDFNYLNTHNKFEEESAAGNPPLWVEATPDTVGLEQAIDILVHLGSFEEPIDSLHGVSFSLTFDQDLLQQSNLTIDFNNCVLGTAGSDVIAFQKRFFNDGVIDLAVTRNTLQNFDGYGPIVHARIVTTDNLSGMHDLPIGISNALAITATEFEVELTTIADTVVIDPNKVGIVEPEQLDVTVYPNPTNGVVTVAGIEKGELLVLNAVGQTVLRADILSSKETLSLDHLPSGLYILHFRTERGVAAKRIRLLK